MGICSVVFWAFNASRARTGLPIEGKIVHTTYRYINMYVFSRDLTLAGVIVHMTILITIFKHVSDHLSIIMALL